MFERILHTTIHKTKATNDDDVINGVIKQTIEEMNLVPTEKLVGTCFDVGCDFGQKCTNCFSYSICRDSAKPLFSSEEHFPAKAPS